jgi:formate hydrogenlyase subunit 6/NADH:ubiquinone oxidoreductase subunit I
MWRKEIRFWEKWQQMWQPRKVIYVVSGECVGCKRCTKVCRHQVLSMVSVQNKVYATACRQEHCSLCGKCIASCPEKAIKMVKVINNNLN